MSQDTQPFLEPHQSQNVLEFYRVAYEYCIFTEKISEKNIDEILDFYLKIGPLVYLKGKLLPEISPEYPETSERYVTEEEWAEIFNAFRAVMGENDEYHTVNYEDFNPYESVKASLAENFSDIYQDLKDFLLLYGKNSQAARENAIHDCRSLFDVRWGPRLLGNLRYLHYLSVKNVLPPSESDFPE